MKFQYCVRVRIDSWVVSKVHFLAHAVPSKSWFFFLRVFHISQFYKLFQERGSATRMFADSAFSRGYTGFHRIFKTFVFYLWFFLGGGGGLNHVIPYSFMDAHIVIIC